MSNPSFGQYVEYSAQLNKFGTAVLDASGNGTVTLRPSGENWRVTGIAVVASTRVLEARCIIYLGNAISQNIILSTYSGSSGDQGDGAPIDVTDGRPLTAVWTGGDVGATVTLTINGWASSPLGGFRASGA